MVLRTVAVVLLLWSGAASADVFYDFPQMMLNLRSDSGENKVLLLRFSVELHDLRNVKPVEIGLPLIMEEAATVLADYSEKDLAGSQNRRKARDALLKAFNRVAPSAQIIDVLFFRKFLILDAAPLSVTSQSQ